LIDPAGNVVGVHAGEGVYPVLKPAIESLVGEFDARGLIDRSPVAVSLEADGMAPSVLSFPGKVVADTGGGRIFIADTNHHRIVVADPETGEVLDVAGRGTPGMAEGPFGSAAFNKPHGMALSEDGLTLYVADVGNHSVRVLDLEERTVATAVGTGFQADRYPPVAGTAPAVSLSSPWDVELDDGRVIIAMAGSHQIWAFDPESGLVAPIVGSGREGTSNGALGSAELAQPSGLALDGAGVLYFADSESSAIRAADLVSGETSLVAGSNADLFDFGDIDAVGSEARLQHPLGVSHHDGVLYVADTYNSKIKTIDLATGAVTTLAGGEQGWRDGADPRFFEPGGLDHAGGRLYVADTNNHAVRIVDPATGSAETLVLYGIEAFEAVGDDYRGTVVMLDPVTVAPGEVTLVVDVGIPDGHKTNDLAPFTMAWTVTDAVADPAPDAFREIVEPAFPQEATATFNDGSGEITADLTVYYCTTENEALCFIEQVRITAPVEVAAGGATSITFPHDIEAPEL
jgi:DNA-binding beta-propeller fold protein YncE